MSYARVNWNSTTTYVSSENLNVMDKGIKDCDDAIVALSIDLQAQINSVNNNLNTIADNLDSKINAFSYVNNAYGKLISGFNYKIGKEMQVNAGYIIESVIPIGASFKLFSVNTKNVPLANIQTNITVAGSNYLLYTLLDTNGDITVTNLSSVAIPVSTTLCLSLRYLTNYYEVS